MNGFIVTLPSSRGDSIYLVAPARVGHPVTTHYPWARTDFVATVFATREAAQAALDKMKGIHHYIAPEVNGGLSKRLDQAQVVPADAVGVGVALDPA
jgi:hypothetical protein